MGVICALLLAAPSAAAPETPSPSDEPRRILVMVDAAHARTGKLLDAEIRELELLPVVVPDSGDTTPAHLDEQARAAGAAAAVRVAGRSGALELWVADRVTGKVALRDVVAPGDAPAAEDIAVLRAMELLRASFIEVRLAAPPRGPVPPAPEVMRMVAQQQRPPVARFAMSAGALVLASVGGAGPQAGAHTALDWRPTPWLDVHLWAALPISGAHLRAPQGNATLSPCLLGIGAARPFRHGRLRLHAGAAAALLWMRVDSTGVSPWTGGRDDSLTAAVVTRAGAAYPVTAGWRVVLLALAGAALQRTVVNFDGTQAGSWGRAFGGLSLALEAGWQ